MAVFVSLRNNSAITAEFELLFPNATDVEMESWAENVPPSREEEMLNDLLEAKVFDIEPRKATLGACHSPPPPPLPFSSCCLAPLAASAQLVLCLSSP
jgi:hypothetical protein